MNENPGGDEKFIHDNIWQDKTYTSGIHELSLKEEIISVFERRGYSAEQAETIAFWKQRENLDGAIERSIIKESHVLYRGLGNIESRII